MSNPSSKKSLLVILSALIFIVTTTAIITFVARGYQLNFKNGIALKATGLLSVTSKPKGAAVYLNDRLITATDDTLDLPPGDYTLKIVKDGYLPWQKIIKIKKEVVFQTDTQLYRSVPDLKPVTFTGAVNPQISPDNTKIVFAVASASATKDNGLYLIDLSALPLPLNRTTPRLISPNYTALDWSKFTFEFSPDSRQFIATSKNGNISYLLPSDSPINGSNLYDVTPRLGLIREEWEKIAQNLNTVKIERLSTEIKTHISTASANNLSYNTAEDKILYLSTIDKEIPQNLITPPPAQSTQKQNRSLRKDYYYVYDLKDDTSFEIGHKDNLKNPFWLPYSDSIIFVDQQSIKVVEYDNTNQNTLFDGKFEENTVYPSLDGNRIITLTSPFASSPENLYSITVK